MIVYSTHFGLILVGWPTWPLIKFSKMCLVGICEPTFQTKINTMNIICNDTFFTNFSVFCNPRSGLRKNYECSAKKMKMVFWVSSLRNIEDLGGLFWPSALQKISTKWSGGKSAPKSGFKCPKNRAKGVFESFFDVFLPTLCVNLTHF